jgi:hypothetical protein
MIPADNCRDVNAFSNEQTSKLHVILHMQVLFSDLADLMCSNVIQQWHPSTIDNCIVTLINTTLDEFVIHHHSIVGENSEL